MNTDLDQIADQMVAARPTKVPALDAVRHRANQRQRRNRLAGIAVLVPLVAAAGIGLLAAGNDAPEPEVVVTAEGPPDEERQPPATAPAEQNVVVTIPIPDLVGLGISDATEQLTAVGLGFEVVVDAATTTRTPGVVINTDPSAGTPVASDTTVMLTATSSAVCGNILPVTIGLTDPAREHTNTVSVDDELALVQEITLDTNERVVIRWPASERTAYDLSDGIPLFFPARLQPAAFNPAGAAYILTGLDKAEQQVGPAVQLTVPPDVEPPDSAAGNCGIVEISITSGDKSALFGWNLANSDWAAQDGAVGFPLANLAPLVTSTQRVASPPTATVGCAADYGQDEPDDTRHYGTPADALASFLETVPAATFIKSGFHEMIADDGSYTFGILSDIPTRTPRATDRFVTLITANESGPGWTISGWTASSC